MGGRYRFLIIPATLAAIGCATSRFPEAASTEAVQVAEGLRLLRAAMGYHHMNAGYLDTSVDIERPEILLYEQNNDGSYRLNGVEFIVPYRFWPRDSLPPTVMGQRLKPEDNLNFWYLHAWAWKRNPEGTFADFHPAVACPDSSRKVYTPPSP